MFERALTHSSRSEENYERLEFLGDRVLGLVIADWLYELFPDEPEGKLSQPAQRPRRRATTCAEVGARARPRRRRCGSASRRRDDGAFDSDNVLGDMVESLIGALWLEAGLRAGAGASSAAPGATASTASDSAPQHPKSALQEWAAANNRKAAGL